MNIDWSAVWAFLWPIVREALIAFLIALLTLLGYDKNVAEARYQALMKSLYHAKK